VRGLEVSSYRLEASVMGDHRSSRKTRPKRKGLYSEGEKNKLIDALLDPLAKEDDIFIVIDSVLHFLNEKDPEASLVKFAKYTLPELLRRWLRKNA